MIKKFNRAVKLTTRAKLALASSMDYHAAFPERLTFLRLLLKDVEHATRKLAKLRRHILGEIFSLRVEACLIYLARRFDEDTMWRHSYWRRFAPHCYLKLGNLFDELHGHYKNIAVAVNLRTENNE